MKMDVNSDLVSLDEIKKVLANNDNSDDYDADFDYNMINIFYDYEELLERFYSLKIDCKKLLEIFRLHNYLLKITFEFADNKKYYILFSDRKLEGSMIGYVCDSEYTVISNNSFFNIDDYETDGEDFEYSYGKKVKETDKDYLRLIQKYFFCHYQNMLYMDENWDEYYNIFTLFSGVEDNKYDIDKNDVRFVKLINSS